MSNVQKVLGEILAAQAERLRFERLLADHQRDMAERDRRIQGLCEAASIPYSVVGAPAEPEAVAKALKMEDVLNAHFESIKLGSVVLTAPKGQVVVAQLEA